MLKNYFKISLRNLRKYKVYSAINLLGLAVGIAVCILILLYMFDELNFDRFHEKADRIYRIVETRKSVDQGEQHFGITAAPVGPIMVNDFPEVLNSARLIRLGRVALLTESSNFYEEFLLSDQNLFEIFDFEFIQGNPETALIEPNSIVITATLAQKYFGDSNPLDRNLKTDRGFDLKVTGVLKDPPHNSHLQFDLLISMSTIFSQEGWRPYLEDWHTIGFITYVLLNERNEAEHVQALIPSFLYKYRGEESGRETEIRLQPLSDIHFYSGRLESDRNAYKGDIGYLYIFGILAGFILLIACINYMNITTARSTTRESEIGMRKVVGASRAQIVRQFLSESVLQAFLAFILGIIIVQSVLSAFNSLTGKKISLDYMLNEGLIFTMIAMVLLVGLISGSYPALYLSRIQFTKILGGKFRSTSSKSIFRHVLVVSQFALSIIMIVATLTVFKQMNFIRNKNLGFNKEHLVVVDINSQAARESFREIKHEFKQNSHVEHVSATSRVPGEWKYLIELEIVPEGGSEFDSKTMNFFGVDSDFLSTFEVTLVEGRNFIETMTTDKTAVLLNETAVKTLGWQSPLGKKIRVPDENFEGRVIGVVKDFHFRSLHESIGPLVLGHSHNPFQSIDYFNARISGTDIPGTIRYLKNVHEKYDKTTPFEYRFLDQQLENFYVSDRRIGHLFGIAAGLAILLACLGLFGLAAFTSRQRTKEIGVRKVLGASVSQIILLLSGEFVKLVFIALIIASPLALIFAKRWLQEFAYQTNITVSIFLFAGIIAFMIALIAMSYQAIKSALANPADSLRYE